jgi:hypothetical protein
MKRQLLAIGMFAALSCAGLRAENAKLVAEIPFPFVMSGQTMPAGEYTFSLNQSILVVRETRGNHSAMALTSPTISAKKLQAEKPNSGVVIFQRYGPESFLTGVWTGNAPEAHAVPETRRQKELAKRIGPADATALALNRK